MITKADLDGKTLGIAFWQRDDNGQDDVIMSSGKCFLRNDQLFIFIGNLSVEVAILENWIIRIKKLEDNEIKKIFHGSDFGLSLKVENLPKDANMNFYQELGLNLNE